MRFVLYSTACSRLAACLVLVLTGAGCALRASTDFGPQSESATRSVGFGSNVLPGSISGVSGPEGNSIGLRGNGGSPSGDAGSAPSADGGTTGSRGGF